MIWNLEIKPKTCQDWEDGECKNKTYSKNYLTPQRFFWVCRKHHNKYNLGK